MVASLFAFGDTFLSSCYNAVMPSERDRTIGGRVMKCWRPQFSIRSLMLLMVIVGLSVGWFVDHSVQSREGRLQASELRRMEGQFGRLTNVFERFQEVLSRERDRI